ncbi:unnamed protein product [Caenorhabditis angaria]|uniref:Uncharacterized protein n=1 Tax=Caenorhabditis angaria TaxID=860376 RepID=A0A9P1MXD3_9PELO|nr:unnamed protein product [Caenorhabditis angaria]
MERTIVKILPTFSAEKYVPFSTIEELLKKEMAQFNTFKYSVVGQKDTKHISKIGQMFTNYFEIRNGTPKTIRRRKVPLQTIKEVEAMMPVDCEIMKMYQDEREREDFASNLTNEQKIERMKQVLEENWKLTMHYRQDIDDPHKFTKFFLNLFIKKGSKY